jgi:hypothetical protein
LGGERLYANICQYLGWSDCILPPAKETIAQPDFSGHASSRCLNIIHVNLPILSAIGLHVHDGITGDLFLIDETDQHYILSQDRISNGDGNDETYKIEKSLVKAILYKPDYIHKLTGRAGDGNRKKTASKPGKDNAQHL